MPASTVPLVLPVIVPVLAAMLATMLAATRRAHGVADPIQDDVRDLEVVRTQHHHVGGAVELAVEARVVKLDIVRLRTPLPGGAPGLDRGHGGVGAHGAARRVIALERQ